jgi:hypothetical protein
MPRTHRHLVAEERHVAVLGVDVDADAHGGVHLHARRLLQRHLQQEAPIGLPVLQCESCNLFRDLWPACCSSFPQYFGKAQTSWHETAIV